MKNLRSFLAIAAGTAALAFGLTACDENSISVKPVVPYEFTSICTPVAKTTLPGEIIQKETVDTKALWEKAATFDVTQDNLESARVLAVRVYTETEDANFDAIQSAVAYIERNGETIEVASISDIPAGSTSVDLTVNTELDVAKYLKEGDFTAVIKAVAKGAVPEMTLCADVKTEVTGSL